MGKYQDLINGLFKHGKLQQANYMALVQANFRAFNPLTIALLGHDNPNVRETCAEILKERKSTKAIPHLIEALCDSNLFVRQDALWAIEFLSGYQPTMLQEWLNIVNTDSPQKMHSRVSQWWQLNRKYIEKIESSIISD